MAIDTLNHAAKEKNDEFYTQLPDITNELHNYSKYFRDKTVFCNCDDPFESNFFKYFALNFNAFGLRKLIATCYDGSPVQGRELPLFGETEEKTVARVPHKIVITEVPDVNNDGATDLADVEWLLRNDRNVLTRLQGNGDFRSPECVELLREADVVVTNPPFSLFREYVAQLVQYNKKFIIIGNMNAITYKEFFPLIKQNKVWSGFGFNLSVVFQTPYENKLEANRKFVLSKGYNPDENYIKTPAVCWFTNIDTSKRHKELDLYKHYTPEEYPKYDNYDAINVDKVADIPIDYDGVMGVPITFLDVYNPDQFELLGSNRGVDQDPNGIYGRGSYLNGKETFKRLFIKRIK